MKQKQLTTKRNEKTHITATLHKSSNEL